MYKFNYTKEQLDIISERALLSDLQKDILKYRIQNYSLVNIADIKHCSISKISRETSEINHKIDMIKNW